MRNAVTWSKRAALWARHPTHLRRVEHSRAILREALGAHPGLYVAWSAGKDSAVCLELAREVRADIAARILTWPETRLLGDYDRVIAAWRERGAHIEEVQLNRSRLSDSVANRWWTLHAEAPGYICGLRADESRVRRITLAKHGQVHLQTSGLRPLLRVSPIAWWQTIDVAAFVVARDLPVLSVYSETPEGFDRRTSSRVPRESVRDDFFTDLQERDPAAMQALHALYPDGERRFRYAVKCSGC